jgi:hypothetical protein
LKFTKQHLPLLDRDTRTRIFNEDINFVVDDFCPKPNETFMDEFHAISRQIQAYLLQTKTISHSDQTFRTVYLDSKLGIALGQQGVD